MVLSWLLTPCVRACLGDSTCPEEGLGRGGLGSLRLCVDTSAIVRVSCGADIGAPAGYRAVCRLVRRSLSSQASMW